MKKTITILLTIAMLFTLCACGKKEEAAPGKESITGKTETYGCFSVLVPDGMELEPGDLLDSSNPNAFTIRDSKEAFRYILISANDEIWIDEGMDFTKELNDGCEFVDCSLPLGNTTFTGFSYVSSGVDCLELKGCLDGVFLQVTAGLVKPTDGRLQAILESIKIDPAKAPKTDASDGGELIDEVLDDMEQELFSGDAEEPAETLSEVQQRWNGWWYGGMDVTGCTGGWSHMNNETYGAGMYIEVDADGVGTMYMFEFGQLLGDDVPNCFAILDCHADTSYLYADSGEAFSDEINPRDWMFVPYTDNPDKIGMGTSFTDEDGDRFGYDLTLMPWGSEWEGEEAYTCFIPGFDEYLSAIHDGQVDPYGNYSIPTDGDSGSSDGSSGGDSGSASGSELSALLGSNPTKLSLTSGDVVFVYYPADQFDYDKDYGKLEKKDGSVDILFDPMLGENNLDELKASYEENNSKEDDYSLTETTVNGYRAIVMTYTDWLNSTMRVDVDFGASHDGVYGMSFAVSGDSLDACNTDLVWAVINSMELAG